MKENLLNSNQEAFVSKMAQIESILSSEFEVFYGKPKERLEKITQAGSDRSYYRFVVEGHSYLGVYSENIAENETFLYYTSVFLELELNVPEVYYISPNKEVYFIEDFGDQLLLDVVAAKKHKFDKSLINLYKKSISQLAKMQISAAGYIDFSKAYHISKFDKESILLDLNYFKYYFLKPSGIRFNEKKLQEDFESFAQLLSDTGDKFFMLRDFQARNILIKDGNPYFIDYQGGRKGAIQYDLASLLFQAKAQVPEEVKQELLYYYIEEINTYISVDKEKFIQQYYFYVYLRVLQVLGAYGLRGIIEKKAHSLESIPYALKNLRDLLADKPLLSVYTELSRVMYEVSESKTFDSVKYSEFTVNVCSFSYKKGLPEDKSGNGGGFVFDCRGIHNPGRYPEYKQLIGRDQSVIDFFKENSEIDTFVENAIQSIKPTVENYIERNFNSLMISFGCTGGRHRSVYCADQVAKYLKENYSITVRLTHREQSIME